MERADPQASLTHTPTLENAKMSQRTIQPAPLGIAGAYFFTVVLFFWPITDLVTTAFPPQLGTVEWRYGFFGLMAAFLHTPILAILLAMALAFSLRQMGALRSLSVLCLLGAGILFLVMVIFALDVVQMRAVTPLEARPSFQVGALIAEAKHFTAFVTLSLFGIGGWKTAGEISSKAKSSDTKGRSGEVLGMPKSV